ncbi:MAG: radical SAM protein [Oligoflexia bacterium]|nr:radical SAM protein [Oligoflexia bacterium]
MKLNKKVIIIEPLGAAVNVFKMYMNLPLMGTVYLGTILKNAGFEVIIYNENFLKKPITIDMLFADFLLLSLITPSAERGYELAKLFKHANPKGMVVIGGVHPTLLPVEATKYADWVVEGEGEEIIVELLKHGHLTSSSNGVSTSTSVDKKIIKTKHIEDLNKIPFPDFNLIYNSKAMDIYPIITSRGCPYNCNFCSVTKTFGRKYRTVDTDRIVHELKTVKQNSVFFYDDNLTANKNRAKELFKKMIDQKIKKSWTAQTRIDVAEDEELLELMKRSGCSTVYIGLESINDKVLSYFHKSQTVEDIEKGISKIHKCGLNIHGMFIFGSDQDTGDIFENTVKFCKKNKIETLQYLALTPFPGTQIFEDMEREERLVHKIWRYYDSLHVVFHPKNLSSVELQNKIISSFEEFYSYAHAISDVVSISNGLSYGIASNIKTFFIRLFARYIIIQWKKLNSSYIHFLKKNKLECN